MVKIIASIFSIVLCSAAAYSQEYEVDKFDTGDGKELEITFVGHGSLVFKYDGNVIHIDPSSREADYETMNDADLILITHHHGDHCNPDAVDKIKTDDTKIISTQLSVDKLGLGTVLPNGESTDFKNINIEAIPAYNLVHTRDNGEFYHPKGTCNSYVLTIGNKRIFIGGDTENTPEMKALENIDIAFLPMNLPYTMTPEMVADAAKAFKPKILYPYHYGKTDTSIIVSLMKDEEEVETRMRNMP
ncbi:MBL fold metallo-hydrolase [Fulvivirga lutea]|uniref:MBL fold metallo-hydrolase n=1 Tax=Fulvivirga lutea TaxID=2810512 RepID=A0A975A1H3_9BACT|nr:MBL fold metallo-hydrolase [Fulvivirga lutea]QSE98245.1 MBL fold metallo-hydrolase [Fulvivirga lutea]